MTGWLAFAALAVAAAVVAWAVARLDRPAMTLVAAALFAAAAGYAWQGSPGYPGAPAAGRGVGGLRPDTLFASERLKLLSPYGEPGQWLLFADGLNRAGEDQAAVSALRGAVARFPRDVGLRIGYAHALLVLADYNFSPAVALAFREAEAMAPGDPAAPYFAALAQLEAGNAPAAEQGWRALYARTPPGSPWHKVLAVRLALFDAMRSGRLPPAQP